MTQPAGLALDFCRGGNGAPYLGRGWGAPEPHGSWTVARDATIILPGQPAPAECHLALRLRPYLGADGQEPKSQELILYVNEVRVLSRRLAGPAVIRLAIPDGAVAPHGAITLRLRLPNAVAPRSLGPSADSRPLGVSLVSLSLYRPAEAPKPAPAATPPPRIAAVTQVYNEAVFLPLWLRHYARQVGAENCFVIDHGSDDGSTTSLGGTDLGAATRIRIPRSPFDPHRQSRFHSGFCSSLLQYYDRVLYSDVDELVLPDPAVAPTLTEYCRRPLPEVVTAIGLNLIHDPDAEPPIDLARPITAQRRHVFFSSSMCKPVLISRPVTWSPGSHSADAPVEFDRLYLFHLRLFDLGQGLVRLRKTRAMPWARTDSGNYQRIADDRLPDLYAEWTRKPARDAIEFDPATAPLKPWLDRVRQSYNPAAQYRISLELWGDERWRIPERFVGAL